MDIVIFVETKNYQRLREILLGDDVVSRASLIFKDAKILTGREGYFCYISGTEEQCKKVLGLVKGLAKEIKDKEKDDIINKIREEEETATRGFGYIFKY
ncbi:MAG: hypothetical protein QXX38_02340 [Candidatus Aenigmatarchaeota archaeon]